MDLQITEQQAKQMAANAINAASPAGIEFLNHEQKNYTTKDIEIDLKGNISYDYFHGRMVKLKIFKTKDGYRVSDYKPRPDYQSWAHQYPTYSDLADSVA